jgi:hypothetical protein
MVNPYQAVTFFARPSAKALWQMVHKWFVFGSHFFGFIFGIKMSSSRSVFDRGSVRFAGDMLRLIHGLEEKGDSSRPGR